MRRQEEITTLLTAFEQYFPGVEKPEIKHLCAWLYRMSIDNVLDVIERIAAQDAQSPFGTPAAAIWKQIKREAPDYTRDAIRFDSSGTRV
jgi:hypothetical protein